MGGKHSIVTTVVDDGTDKSWRCRGKLYHVLQYRIDYGFRLKTSLMQTSQLCPLHHSNASKLKHFLYKHIKFSSQLKMLPKYGLIIPDEWLPRYTVVKNAWITLGLTSLCVFNSANQCVFAKCMASSDMGCAIKFHKTVKALPCSCYTKIKHSASPRALLPSRPHASCFIFCIALTAML